MRQSSARVFVATGLLAGVTAVLASGAAASYAGIAQAGTVKVSSTADTNKFVPPDPSVAQDADGMVTIEFESHGTHTMQADGIEGFDTGIVGDGQTKTLHFAIEPGTYDFYCNLHKSVGMTGKLTVTAGKGGATTTTPSAETTTAAPTATASATKAPVVPTASSSEEGVPGIAGNVTLEQIEAERAAQHGAVSGFRFFTMVATAFVVVLGAGIMFSTRPRRAGR